MTVDRDIQDTEDTEDTEDTADKAEVVDETPTDAEPEDNADTGESTAPEEQDSHTGLIGALRKRFVPILLAVLLVASGAVAAWLYLAQVRPDQQTDAAAAQVVTKAATDGTISLLSYAPKTLDKDFATAKSHLTGDFLSYYTDFTSKVVTPAVKQKSVKTKAEVQHAAVSELHPNSATVLVFVNQVTTSQENPDGAFAGSAVRVGLTKIDGNWLISSFDPV